MTDNELNDTLNDEEEQVEVEVLPQVVNKSKAIADELLQTDDPQKIKDLITLFNLQTKKKNISRAVKVSDMLDSIVDTLYNRLLNSPQQLQNFELVDYLSKLDTYLGKISDKDGDPNDKSLITLTQNNQINIINDGDLNTQSRKNVTEAVRKILQNISLEDKSEAE